jgi:hypothetical protein
MSDDGFKVVKTDVVFGDASGLDAFVRKCVEDGAKQYADSFAAEGTPRWQAAYIAYSQGFYDAVTMVRRVIGGYGYKYVEPPPIVVTKQVDGE